MHRLRPFVCVLSLVLSSTWLLAQEPGREPGSQPVRPNYKQAQQYSAEFLRQRTYSTSVRPQWIGETDRFWYRFSDSAGTRYHLVDPNTASKTPLFDHERLAAELSVEVRKPQDAERLDLENGEVDDEGKVFSFVLERTKFELELATGKLVNKGETSREDARRPGSGRSNGSRDPRGHRNFSPDRTAYVFSQGHDLYFVEASEEVKAEILAIDARMKAEEEAKEKAEAGEGDSDETNETTEKTETTKKTETEGDEVEVTEKQDIVGEVEQTEQTEGDVDEDEERRLTVVEVQKVDGSRKREADSEEEVDERERWADDVDESKALRLTTDGEEDYDFAGFGRRWRGSSIDEDAQGSDFEYDDYAYDVEWEDAWTPQDDEDEDDEGDEDSEEDSEPEKVRPSVSWAPDSSAFYATRRDSRGVEELFLVNSIAEPRPALEKYKYAMPGEEDIRRSELHVFDRASKELTRLTPKWKDESYRSLDWAEEGSTLRLVRRDRLMRNAELCTLDPRTMEPKVLIEEGFESAYLAPQGVRYLEERQELIWWSERTGWGHFYLYGLDGTLKHAITSGTWRASRILDVDEEKGLLYFRGNGREAGENIYLEHTYCVFLDGSDLTLLDPGNANHRSELSPTKNFLVDNCSRIDMAPISLVRNSRGGEVLRLEETDLSRLVEAGWRMPETFTVKAVDGVTDLYGNMWKPFDFDPEKRYPIIAEVYPGPQTEGVSHTFSASNARQQLAQIGFIVIQVGHRGGTPTRSKAYHSYGYFNLRDYGLEDKKAAIEELAKRHPFIDVDRVGLYGHSGGGFMTAAAMMLPPYNDFFKAGIASAGNHDNNIYNNSWAERYHGLKEVAVEKEQSGRGGSDRRGRGGATGPQDEERGQENEGEDEDEGDDGETRFEIRVPTNQELAANLKGRLLLVHGEIDNNVHPANTMRLVDALIKANKRFDLMIIPGARHGFGAANRYFNHMRWEFFAEHLLGDRQPGADIVEKD